MLPRKECSSSSQPGRRSTTKKQRQSNQNPPMKGTVSFSAKCIHTMPPLLILIPRQAKHVKLPAHIIRRPLPPLLAPWLRQSQPFSSPLLLLFLRLLPLSHTLLIPLASTSAPFTLPSAHCAPPVPTVSMICTRAVFPPISRESRWQTEMAGIELFRIVIIVGEHAILWYSRAHMVPEPMLVVKPQGWGQKVNKVVGLL